MTMRPHLLLPLLLLLTIACGDDNKSNNDSRPTPTGDMGADLDTPDQAAPDASVDTPDAAPDASVDETDADGDDQGTGEDMGADLEEEPDLPITEPPTLSILSPLTGDITRRYDVTFKLHATNVSALTISLNGAQPVALDLVATATGEQDTYTISLPPAPGENTAEITALDAQGRSDIKTVSFRFGAPIAAGGAHAGAIRANGLYGWGRNNKGQLGDGTTTATSAGVATPTVISGLTSPAVIAYNQNASAAIAQGGTVWTWGDGGNGQLGHGASTDGTLDVADRLVPTQIPNLTDAVSVVRGYSHTLVLRADGTVWAFGNNAKGQLGDGTTEHRDRPTQVAGLSDVVVIGAGSTFSVALRRDGTVWTWGANAAGQLGNNTSGSEANPTPAQVAGLSGIYDIATGKDHVLAIDAQGALWAWGSNQSGQVGDGNSGSDADVLVPKAITTAAPVRKIFGNANYSFAILADGSVYGWGQNFNGQLGLGGADTTEQPSPTLAATNLIDPVWLALGATHAIAQVRAGSVWSWGWHFAGALGHPALEDRWTQTSPLEVSFP